MQPIMQPITTAELYTEWRAKLLAYFARTSYAYEAEDLVQEVFVRYMQALCRGACFHTPERLLWRAARNVLLDRHRYHTRRPSTVDADVAGFDLIDPRQPDPLELVCLADARDAVDALLPELTPAQRDVLALHYGAELEYADVADLLGITLGSAKARGLRALVCLRHVTGAAGALT